MKNAKASGTDGVKTPVSIYLVRTTQVEELKKAFTSKAAVSIAAPEGFESVFYALPSEPSEPKWLSEVKALFAPDSEVAEITSQVAGGLMLLNFSGRLFAVSFGTGWLRLNNYWLELDFGRQVALNSIPHDKLIELKAEQVFARRHISSERAPVTSNRNAFGLDFDRDLLGVVEGAPDNAKHLGLSVIGGASLRLKIDIRKLFDAITEALVLYGSKAYQTHWPEVDNLIRVKDSALIAELDGLLDAALTGPITMDSPLLVNSGPRRDAEHLASLFVIGDLPRKRKECSRSGAPYLERRAWDRFLKFEKLKASLASAKSTAVHALDVDGDELYRTDIYNCLAYEASRPDAAGVMRPFILSQGTWYQTNLNFVNDVNAKMNVLAKKLPPMRLLAWTKPENEGQYNQRNVIGNIVHFDAKLVYFGGGQSKFEFCDLMDLTTQTLYFVKIAVNSSHMSHLAEQIRRTAELFFSADSGFRSALATVVTKHHPTMNTSWVRNRPRHGDWNLCLVPLGKTLQQLPFFAKCGVYRLAKELESRGHSFVCDER
jgi:uncharacterized protein (TIGR04141 family)